MRRSSSGARVSSEGGSGGGGEIEGVGLPTCDPQSAAGRREAARARALQRAVHCIPLVLILCALLLWLSAS
ncbi:hypothetical protein OsI_23602 [Oryza sativa Indica Group]|jgi:hypothetical protein|uniref:Uncharacterized protein n=4 Tax=Oryza TaxID=4527 RepID=B9FU13_ORYSJ|nr:hypothetical protein OsI_23602 [Oryza sativa Indica Group]EEE65975.1 hypothetical protein OsJ_21887 [Oryza sativa Japonica Group]KAF2927437.1 hypothetical protein DAI22_06g205400 [Oryza sativa Japonica Group]KAF2927438.1 hypothetical protein DAI22_06g205400 [Oryza sativa Japonica Group]